MIPVEADFSLAIAKEPHSIILSEEERNLIDEVWREETALSSGHLFNGRILHMLSFDEKRAIGSFIEYKFFLAGEKAPALREKMALCPIALSAYARTNDAVLFGLRSHHVTQYPFYWELVPSGGISDRFVSEGLVDYRREMLRELEEETGISSSQVKSNQPMALSYDRQSPILEIVMEIVLEEKHVLHPSSEHSELRWLHTDAIASFLSEQRVIPISRQILAQKK